MVDYPRLADEIAAWIAERVRDAGCRGVVLGLSGGVDSALSAGLAQRALGAGSVLGLIMPCHSVPGDEAHARLVIDTFGIAWERVDLGPVFDVLTAQLPTADGLAAANLKPRLRMMTLYYYASMKRYLVLGTSNRTELAVGYFTKYGDGGSDILPLGGLLKYEVRELARAVRVPAAIVDKPPSGGLWAGQTDEGELGITYDRLDRVIAALDCGDTSGLDPNDVARVKRMFAVSAHKREPLPCFRVSA